MQSNIVNMYNSATILLEKKKYVKAISEYKRVLKLFPNKETYLNLGNCHRAMHDNLLAVQCFRKAADEKVPYLDGKMGAYPLAINNIGLHHYASGDNTSAIVLYREAITLDNEYMDAHWNLASALLRGGVDTEGWDEYEFRFHKTPPVKLHVDTENLKFWDGSRCRNLIILAEQGIGDQFMWGRYFALAKQMCTSLYIQSEGGVAEIFQLAGYNTIRSTSQVDIDVSLDYAIPICSLSRAFGAVSGDWLREIVPARSLSGERLKVGIVWSGSPTHANDFYRSVAVHRFHRQAKYASLYSLKPDFSGNKYVTGLDIGSWKDTFGWLGALDLVISVDTSIVHACGAAGVECWMLQPSRETDFRWGLDALGSGNEWYSSVKVYRNPNDWDFVFDRVEEELRELVGGRVV